MIEFVLGALFMLVFLMLLGNISNRKKERYVEEIMAEKYDGYIVFEDGERLDVNDVPLSEIITITNERKVLDMDINGHKNTGAEQKKEGADACKN